MDVNFIVDDVHYATIKTNGTKTIEMPDDPVKEGYVFAGWYWDNGIWEKPFNINSILDAPLSKNMKVYAKWNESGIFGTDNEFVSSSSDETANPVLNTDSVDGTAKNFFGITPDGYTFASYAGGTLYHWTWDNENKYNTLCEILLSKGYRQVSEWNSDNAMSWCGTRIEMNTVNYGYYHVEYFDGNGNMLSKAFSKDEETNTSVPNNNQSSDLSQYSATVAAAVKEGTRVATGSRGDYIVKVAATPELIAISNLRKTGMFLSVTPFSHTESGYILINVVSQYDQYRVLGYEITSFNGGYYAVCIPA
ncbi:MAG: InlB B-repeat-containing protein [Christensenellales bacterium]